MFWGPPVAKCLHPHPHKLEDHNYLPTGPTEFSLQPRTWRVPSRSRQTPLARLGLAMRIAGDARTMVRIHQPGQAEFKAILPKAIDWKPFPAFAPSVRLAALVGQPSERGPYVIRVKVLLA
jgi:hypothetical protein